MVRAFEYDDWIDIESLDSAKGKVNSLGVTACQGFGSASGPEFRLSSAKRVSWQVTYPNEPLNSAETTQSIIYRFQVALLNMCKY